MMATARLSTAVAVHAVQPLFEAPPSTNLLTARPPPAGLAQKDVIASIARTTLFVIGKRSGQVSSPEIRNFFQLKAVISSSVNLWPLPLNTRGWLGTMRTSLTTELVAS